ncbi:hypothetical protein ACFQU2_21590 [Siccirubricoccus deserti]
MPYAVILVLGGMALALVPDVPVVRLDPESRSPSSCRRCCRPAPSARIGGPSAATCGRSCCWRWAR